ncbi:MAG: SNF2-related protein [Candidatus Rokuibacteriota bacterium]
MPLEEIQTIEDYLGAFGWTLAERVAHKYPPVYDPRTEAPHPRMGELLRRPFRAQADCITGLARAFEQRRGLALVGEMGSGKTLMAAALLHILHQDTFRALVMAPGHLVRKWARELELTVPRVTVRTLSNYIDCVRLKASSPRKPTGREVYVISRDRSKLGPSWRPVYFQTPRRQAVLCVHCGSEQKTRQDEIIPPREFERMKRKCVRCQEPMWSVDRSGPRRYAPADFISRHLKGWWTFFIADEVHELKGATTAQGQAFGRLAAAAHRTLILTGTLSGGLASNIHLLIARIAMQSLLHEGLGYRNTSEWIRRYGIHERVTVTTPASTTGPAQTKHHHYERPGISPVVFARHLIDQVAFLELADLAVVLPPLTEEVRAVEMDPPLRAAYDDLRQDLRSAVAHALHRRYRGLLGSYITTLLAYLDHPAGFSPIRHPSQDTIIAVPRSLPLDHLYAKDRALLEIIEAEAAANRRVFVFVTNTERHDVAGRLARILTERGYQAETLRASVAPEHREQWLGQQVAKGVQVVIGNPGLVQTGLDLTGALDFPTLVFYQAPLSAYTLRQASRRSHRIGSDRPVRVVYLSYEDSVGATALSLLGSKIQSSLAIEGRFSMDGLAAMSDSTDITTALAASLVGDLQDLESAETIWRRVAELEAQHLQTAAAEQLIVTAASEAESAAPSEPAPAAPDVVTPGPGVVPDAPLVAVPDVPVTIITEILGHGRRRRAAARAVDGDVPPNSQLAFGWLLTS